MGLVAQGGGTWGVKGGAGSTGRRDMEALAGHLSNGIEDVLKEDEGGAPCNLGDVEQRLTGHVADFGVWVSEAGHHRRDQLRKVHAHTLLCAGRTLQSSCGIRASGWG